MAAVAVGNWHQQFAPMRSHFQHVHPRSTSDTPIAPRNEREMSRDFLITVLDFFAKLLPSQFNNHPLRLVVHGGACMLLHPRLARLASDQHYLAASSPANSPHNVLPRRTSTRDVDYIHRSFVAECEAMGISNATERLKVCIKLTAQRFQLGADWMNSDADIALPMSHNANGASFDPIYRAAITPHNIEQFTVFSSANGMLTLVSVPPVWSIVLKLVRYTNHDPGDICILLRNGVNVDNCHWTAEKLEKWLSVDAAAMSFHWAAVARRQELRARIEHAIQMVTNWDYASAQGPVIPALADYGDGPSAFSSPSPPPARHIGQHPSTWSTPRLDSGQDSSLELHDRWLEPRTRSRSHHAELQAKPNADVDRAERDWTRSRGTDKKAERRVRDKDRSTARLKDRFSKWVLASPYLPESDDESSDDDDNCYHCRHVPAVGSLPAPPIVTPRPSAHRIYAPTPPPPPPSRQSHQSPPLTTFLKDNSASSPVVPFIPPLPASMASNPFYANPRRSMTPETPFIPPLSDQPSTSPNPFPSGHYSQRPTTSFIPPVPDHAQWPAARYPPRERYPSTTTPPHPVQDYESTTPYYYHEERHPGASNIPSLRWRPPTPIPTMEHHHSPSLGELSPIGAILTLQ